MVLMFGLFISNANLPESQMGRYLFDFLQIVFRCALWIIVPLMTADCVSQERREGTLGLLFLTPLTVADVLFGKASLHILRSGTLLLAALPVLVLPFMLGGVSLLQVLSAGQEDLSAVLLGTAAGLYASVLGGTTIQVMVTSLGLALGLFLGQAVVLMLLIAIAGFALALGALLGGLLGHPALAGAGVSALGNLGNIPLITWGISLALPLALFLLVSQAAIRRLRVNWSADGGGSAGAPPRWVSTFAASEFWRAAFRWDRGSALDRNPVAWLQEYSWTARLTKWGWLCVLLGAEFIVLLGDFRWQILVFPALLLGVAFSAANSFRRERREGALEILLVTPLSAVQLIQGRLWGIGCHYFPALAVLALGWFAARQLNFRSPADEISLLTFPSPITLLAVMIFGLWLSLRGTHLLVLWLVTWTFAFLVPVLGAIAVGRTMDWSPSASLLLVAIVQAAVATAGWFALLHNLRSRKFLEVAGRQGGRHDPG